MAVPRRVGPALRRVVVDASALAAIVFQEPDGKSVAAKLDGATVFAPRLLKYELANVAWKKARRTPEQAAAILTALERALSDVWAPVLRDVDHNDAVLVAQAAGLSTYDASYLWLAGTLGADLVTLDRRLAAMPAAGPIGV